MDPIIEALSRLEAKLDRLINGPVPDAISAEDCMPLTGCKSRSAQFRWFKDHNVRPYARGRYRRIDVTNARDRAALFPKL